MEIYVDELPKKCKGCPLHNEDNGWCQVLICYTDDVPTDCPLKPLTDRLTEERKKVCELVYKKCEPLFRLVNNYDNGDVIERNELVDILDQIERDTND